MSEATAGEESAAWLDAAKWLETVEHDAKTAARKAWQAVESTKSDRWEEAAQLIDFAINLERKYRTPVVWVLLARIIHGA